MSEIEDLYPPAQYGGVWLLIVAGIIVLGVIVACVLIWATRPRYSMTREVASERPFVDVVGITQALRNEYFARLQRIEDDYRASAIDAREANRRLSREVRGFVQDYSGFEAPVLGLDDLIGLGVHPSLIDAMQRHYYPSIFRRDIVIDPVAGLAAGRLVVNSWH